MSVVIVDDQDPLISYSPSAGGWTKKGHFEEYLATTMDANSGGSTASFSFQGTSIAVYGTVGPVGGGGASMSFSIDQSAPTFFSTGPLSSSVHHEPLFTSDTLDNGTHSLVITQISGAGQVFLDYFLYNATSTAGNTVFIDDNDSQLDYSEGWSMGPNSPEFFQNTAHTCEADECSLNLDFKGNSLSIYGAFAGNSTSPPPTFSASITVDGGPPTSLRILNSPSRPQPTSNLKMFESPLGSGSHRAVLTTHNSDQFFLDYLLVGGDGPSAFADPAVTSVDPAVTSASTPIPSAISGASKVPVAAVVGIAVGGLVFLTLLLVALFLWRRRTRHLDAISHESFTAIPPPVRQRPQSTLSVATLLGDGAAPGETISDKDVEARKGRPASRYLYYDN